MSMDPVTEGGPTPAASAAPAAPERRAAQWALVIAYALLIIAVWAVLQLWGLGKAPFHTKGEPREGLVVWEMTHGGGWILPKRNGHELPSKPPLFHWLAALVSLAHGATDEWSIRLPSAALSLAGLLGVFATGGALWNPRAGLCSALVLMTTFEWARAATNGRVDMALTFGLEVAFLSLLFFLRSRAAVWLAPLYAGITLAVLGKGPVGAALPGLVGLAMVILLRDARLLREMRLGYGALTVAAGAGSWYALALLFGGLAFFRKQVLAENVFTFLQSAAFGGGHRHGAGYLIGALALGLLPWSLFVPGVAARLWRTRASLSVRDPRVYLLVWIAVVLGFYSIAASKRSVYLLALYPAVALLFGWWWDEQSRAPAVAGRWVMRLIALCAWMVLGTVLLVLLFVLVESVGVPLCALVQRGLPVHAQPFAAIASDTIRGAPHTLLAAIAVAAAASYACVRVARRAQWLALCTRIVVVFAAVMVAARQVVLPGIARALTSRNFIHDVRQLVPPGELSFFGALDYQAIFYWQGHIPRYQGPWPPSAPRYLLMEAGEWERVRDSVREQYERVAVPNDAKHDALRHLVLIRRVPGR